jgi:hypothetical protein
VRGDAPHYPQRNRGHPNVRGFAAAFVGVALLLGGMAYAQIAQETYPNRPVRMIVPFGAGGPGDIFARLIAQKLSEQLGRQFFVENRAGAGGNIGAGLAARAPADGYTLLVGSSTVWVNASLYPQMPYDPVKDFDPIIIAATSPEVLVVHPSVPANNVQELITLVRAGTYNNFAIPGTGTPPHLSTELFKLSLNLDFVTVPFGGGGPMVQSVVAGHSRSRSRRCRPQRRRSRRGCCARSRSPAGSASRSCPTCRRWKKAACRVSGAGGAAVHLGARRHAARDHRSFVPRDRAGGRDAGAEAEDGGDRLRAGRRAAGGARRADQGGYAEMGEADQRRKNQAVAPALRPTLPPLVRLADPALDSLNKLAMGR